MNGKMTLLASLCAALAACVPSAPRLVEHHRFGDALCVASNRDEAMLVARAAWQSVAPQAYVHIVSADEWGALLPRDRADGAHAGYLAIRAEWTSNRIAVRKQELGFELKVTAGDSRIEWLPAASRYEQRAIAVEATGERLPPRHAYSHTEHWQPPRPRDPLGAILSLFAPTSSTTTVMLDPEPREYAEHGPLAYALVQALVGGEQATGFIVRKSADSASELIAELKLEDRLVDVGNCTLTYARTLEPELGQEQAEKRISTEFAAGYRPIESLAGQTVVTLDNPSGRWRFELP